MSRVPGWLIVLVVVLVVLFLLNAFHLVSIHGSVSADVWPNPLRPWWVIPKFAPCAHWWCR